LCDNLPQVERFNGVVFFSLATLQHLQNEQWVASSAWMWRWCELGSLFFVSEFIVDWTKHAFISKFNDIQPQLYSKFSNAMYKDLTLNPTASSTGVQVDRMQVVSRRIGFTPLPLACVFARLVYTAVPVLSWFNLLNDEPMQPLLLLVVILLAFVVCTLLKLLVCIVLLGHACINRMSLPPQGEEEDNDLERFNFARHIVF
jgi:transmembrane anterior posterior transformation protein 1